MVRNFPRHAALTLVTGLSLVLLVTTAKTATVDVDVVPPRMAAAHGGLDRWRSAPTVSFRDDWKNGFPTSFTIHQSTRRAYFDAVGRSGRGSWDGEKAWSESWEGSPPRFVALLSYYFANLPWLASDPGVVLKDPGTGKIPGDPAEYATVRMEFEPGVGDTPEDQYVLYIDPKTFRLRACEYTVTYAGVLPEGMAESPKKLLVYDEWEVVDGLSVPRSFTIYDKSGDVYAECSISDWSFSTTFDESRMQMPASAVLDDSKP